MLGLSLMIHLSSNKSEKRIIVYLILTFCFLSIVVKKRNWIVLHLQSCQLDLSTLLTVCLSLWVTFLLSHTSTWKITGKHVNCVRKFKFYFLLIG